MCTLPWTISAYVHMHIVIWLWSLLLLHLYCSITSSPLNETSQEKKTVKLLCHSWHLIKLCINSLNSYLYLSLCSNFVCIAVVLFGNYNGIFETVWRKFRGGRGYLYMYMSQRLTCYCSSPTGYFAVIGMNVGNLRALPSQHPWGTGWGIS